MKRSLYKSILTVLLSALVTAPTTSPIVAAAKTESETDAAEGGETEEGETEEAETEESKTEEEDKSPPVTDSSFEDENGVQYKWYGYADGTAEIYEMSCRREIIVIDIPEEIEGYLVTRLTGMMRNATIASVTLPETLEYLGNGVFNYATIGELYFNSREVRNEGDFFHTPFCFTKVEQICFGEQVEGIADYTFYETVFDQPQLMLHVPKIGKHAFHSASMKDLTITNDVRVVDALAFELAVIQLLHYNCPDVLYENVEDLLSGPFSHAEICGLDFSDDVHAIPDYCFSEASFQMKEFSFDVERIGDYAFHGVWDSSDLWPGTDMVDKLTLSDSMKYIGKEAFGGCYINELVLDATVECGSTSILNGVFYTTDIHRLTLGEEVAKIPDYFFAYADFCFDELTVSVPQIGTGSFSHVWCTEDDDTPRGKLTVTEQVEVLGTNAFEGNRLEVLCYESNAVTQMTEPDTGVFDEAEIGQLAIGDEVEKLGGALFSGSCLHQDEVIIPDSVREIGAYAFYDVRCWCADLPFHTLRIGTGMRDIDPTAFGLTVFKDIYVESLQAAEHYKEVDESSDGGDFPRCENLHIHRGLPFYALFSRKAENEQLYCTQFLVSETGEEFFDSQNRQYVTLVYDTCSVCGYQKVSQIRENACEVIFLAHGEVLERKYCKKNGSVTAPTVPEKEFFRFSGWDKDFSNVTTDLIVQAIYTIITDTELPLPKPEPDEETTTPGVFPEPETEPGEITEPLPPLQELDAGTKEPETKPDMKPVIPHSDTKPSIGEAEPDEEMKRPGEKTLTPQQETLQTTQKPVIDPVPQIQIPKPLPVISQPESKPDISPVPGQDRVTDHPDPVPANLEPVPVNPDAEPGSSGVEPTDPYTGPDDPGTEPDSLEPESEPDNPDSDPDQQDPEPEHSKPQQEPEEDEDKEAKTRFPVAPIVAAILVGLGGGCGTCFLFLSHRRKLRGMVVNADGLSMGELRVTLDDKEAYTDERGNFVFSGMKRGNHDLCIYRLSGNMVLHMNICTECAEDSKIFTTLADSCLSVDAHRDGKNYLIDVAITE